MSAPRSDADIAPVVVSVCQRHNLPVHFLDLIEAGLTKPLRDLFVIVTMGIYRRKPIASRVQCPLKIIALHPRIAKTMICVNAHVPDGEQAYERLCNRQRVVRSEHRASFFLEQISDPAKRTSSRGFDSVNPDVQQAARLA